MGTANIRGFEARRMQTLQGHTRLTQEAIKTAGEIIQRAMESGQVHARVQTIFLSHRQFIFTHLVSAETHALNDMYTLLPLAGTEKRVSFASCILEFLEWLRAQGLQTIFTTCTYPGSGGAIPAPFIHIEALFVPETPPRAPLGTRAIDIWNTQYMQKCVDESSIPAWTQRCADAIRRGATHFVVCTLYRGSDFFPPSEGGGILCLQPPRHHLTLNSVADLMAHQNEPNPFVLNTKFSVMVAWVRDIGYAWTLLMANVHDASWAYFAVLLDPLESYASAPHPEGAIK
jgi:hypothetical protein